MSAASVEFALQKAYGKLLSLARHIAALKAAHNCQSPILRLPREILSRILSACAQEPYHTTDHWLAFSQVCTEWRHSALGDRSLWTHIDLRVPNLARRILERARSMPLSISCSSFDQLYQDFVPPNDRVRAFRLFRTTHLIRRTESRAIGYLSGSLPQLETLFLSGDYDAVQTFDSANLVAPRLRTLHLHHWTLRDWTVPWLERLTSLHLEFNPRYFNVSHFIQHPGDPQSMSTSLVTHTTEFA